MKILVDDGGRYNKYSGYGQLSRTIVQALSRAGHECLLIPQRPILADDLAFNITRVPGVTFFEESSAYDLVFRISPPSRTQYPGESVLYTQNGLSDLRQEWQRDIQDHSQIIVPSTFDADVFKKYHHSVNVCPQAVHNDLYRPVPKYRKERNDDFQFLFVGSFSFRKGVDLLFSILAEAALAVRDRKIGLSIYCPTGLSETAHSLDRLIEWTRNAPENLAFHVVNKELSPRWMSRIYNQHDAVLTFSRGEGWCMPLYEGLLSKKPVVAPDSTAMGECLPRDGVIRVPVQARAAQDVKDEFGQTFVHLYGEQEIQFFEVDAEESVRAIVDMITNYSRYEKEAEEGRRYILENYSIEAISSTLSALV